MAAITFDHCVILSATGSGRSPSPAGLRDERQGRPFPLRAGAAEHAWAGPDRPSSRRPAGDAGRQRPLLRMARRHCRRGGASGGAQGSRGARPCRAHGRQGHRHQPLFPRSRRVAPRIHRLARLEAQDMYQAIVFLPLLGFLLAGIASLLTHKLGRDVAAWSAADHSGHGHHGHDAHGHGAHGHDDHHAVEPSPHSEGVIRFAEIVTTALLFVACALSWIAFIDHNLGKAGSYTLPIANWISSGALQVSWALRIDPLTCMMLVVVTTVSSLVHLYSIGYMHEDPHRPRFFAYLSLFTFAMLMLVTSDNLVQMFFGWEGVGLASYLLIGFWYKKQSAKDAAMKAFIVNRVGDFGFALGIFMVFWLTGSVSLRADLRRGARPEGCPDELHRHPGPCDDHRLHPAVHGRDGQVGAVPAAHLAAGRDGRPDAGFGAHPCRDDGDRRRVHGGAAVAAVRTCALGAGGRDHHWRHDGVLRRDRRPGAERHQARRRLFDLLAARLHVRGARRRRLRDGRLPPLHPRLLQGAAVPGLPARSSTRCTTSRTSGTWAAWRRRSPTRPR